MRRGRAGYILLFATLLGGCANALAVPILQVYVQDADYDPQTETWLRHHPGHPVDLWVIAQTPVMEVKLAAAYDIATTPIITLAGSSTGGHGGFTDPSVVPNPAYIRTVTDGSSPKLGDGSDLPTHGIYGTGTAWQEFSLGDFTLNDSPLADFIDSFPEPGNAQGQINVYSLTVSGTHWVHIDVYDHVAAGNHVKYTFAPFSHDAGVTNPEPASGLLVMIVAGEFLRRRRRPV